MRIARRGGIAPDRLQQILSAPEADPARYPLPPTVVDQGTLFSTAFKSRVLSGNSWTLTAVMVLTSALVAHLVLSRELAGLAQGAAYVVGLVTTLALYLVATNYVPLRGYSLLRRRLNYKLEREGTPSRFENALFVGFAPAPRIYEGFYDWDVGFLLIEGDRLEYVGEQARFALRRDQVVAVRMGPGGPGWLRAPRIYVTWHDEEQEADRSFNMRPITARSIGQLGREARALAKQLQAWREQPSTSGATPSALAGANTPDVGEVTSLSPRALLNSRNLIGTLLIVAALAAGVGVLLGLPFDPEQGGAGWYVVGVALLACIFQWLPYFVYREPAGKLWGNSTPRPVVQ